MKRTVNEWQKRIDALRISGQLLVLELRIAELRKRYAVFGEGHKIVGNVSDGSGGKGGGGVDKSGKSGIINYAKGFEYNAVGTPNAAHVTVDEIFAEMERSQVGKEAVDYLNKSGVKPLFIYEPQNHSNRGLQQGNKICLYMDNIHSPLVAAQTLIHETCHCQYGIGQSQWAETVCMAKEKMHKENRTKLTVAERRKLVSLARNFYGEFQWRKGGQIGGRWV